MEPKLFWDLYQEIGYATDDACRVKQKKEDPQALEERSYTSTTYPTTGAVFTEVQKLEKLMKYIYLKLLPTINMKEKKHRTPWYVNCKRIGLSPEHDFKLLTNTQQPHIMFEFIASVFIPTLTNMFMEFAWAACAAMLAYTMNKVCNAS
jgi:hypothetical protein